MDTIEIPYPLDAEILGGPTSEAFWLRHPHVTNVTIDTFEGVQRSRLVLAEAANDRGAELRKWVGSRRPEGDPDLTFDNVGGAPPPWFWNEHPDVVAYSLEYDDDDGSAWWVKLWIRKA